MFSRTSSTVMEAITSIKMPDSQEGSLVLVASLIVEARKGPISPGVLGKLYPTTKVQDTIMRVVLAEE